MMLRGAHGSVMDDQAGFELEEVRTRDAEVFSDDGMLLPPPPCRPQSTTSYNVAGATADQYGKEKHGGGGDDEEAVGEYRELCNACKNLSCWKPLFQIVKFVAHFVTVMVLLFGGAGEVV